MIPRRFMNDPNRGLKLTRFPDQPRQRNGFVVMTMVWALESYWARV
jgi:hypothetical protein